MRPRSLRASRLSTLVLVLATAFAPADARAQDAGTAPAAEAASLVEGDAHWAKRDEGATGGQAAPDRTDAAIAAYRRALAASPDSLEARWRLMRALYFRGEHVAVEIEEKKKLFAAGRDLGEEALALLRRKASAAGAAKAERASPVELVPHVRALPAALPSFFWAGVDWGKWALVFGKSAAVKQGAAAKIRDYAQATILLDAAFEEGGGYRVLGRLHHQTPAVPFLTGWASRAEALRNLRLAVKAAPRNFLNRLYLAEAMWDYEKEKRPNARAALTALLSETPAPEVAVEERRAQDEAKALLSRWGPG